MDLKVHGTADFTQIIKGGHGDIDFVANAIDIHNHLVWLLAEESSGKVGNHGFRSREPDTVHNYRKDGVLRRCKGENVPIPQPDWNQVPQRISLRKRNRSSSGHNSFCKAQ